MLSHEKDSTNNFLSAALTDGLQTILNFISFCTAKKKNYGPQYLYFACYFCYLISKMAEKKKKNLKKRDGQEDEDYIKKRGRVKEEKRKKK